MFSCWDSLGITGNYSKTLDNGGKRSEPLENIKECKKNMINSAWASKTLESIFFIISHFSLDFGFWILDFGFWILDGFWMDVLDFGYIQWMQTPAPMAW